MIDFLVDILSLLGCLIVLELVLMHFGKSRRS